MIGIELFYLDSSNSNSSPVKIKSQPLESTNQINVTQNMSSNEFNNRINEKNRISHNDSASDVQNSNDLTRFGSSNFSGIFNVFSSLWKLWIEIYFKVIQEWNYRLKIKEWDFWCIFDSLAEIKFYPQLRNTRFYFWSLKALCKSYNFWDIIWNLVKTNGNKFIDLWINCTK